MPRAIFKHERGQPLTEGILALDPDTGKRVELRRDTPTTVSTALAEQLASRKQDSPYHNYVVHIEDDAPQAADVSAGQE